MLKDSMTSETGLWIIDIQQRFVRAIDDDHMARTIRTAGLLIELAAEVGANIVYTEQYPEGLGLTVEELRPRLEAAGARRFEKVHFDACDSPALAEELAALPPRIVVCGIEAHVCVRSTVVSLIARGVDVLVPFDGIASRRREYRDNAVENMREAGAVITNGESIVFDSLKSSHHDAFKRFSKLIR